MTKQVIIRVAATTALALSLTGAAASADILGPTGPDSNNSVSSHFSNSQSVDNDNHVGLTGNNGQQAYTGDATAAHNTTAAGTTGTGDASNSNGFSVDASINNGAGMAGLGQVSDPSADLGSIGTTGPDSDNSISSYVSNDVHVNNDNDVNIVSNNQQSARSGSATVADNTTGGNAKSGDATNQNQTQVQLQVQN